MMLVKNYLTQSAIHGIGVYADEPIKAGQRIWTRGLELIFEETEMAALPKVTQEYLHRYCYREKEAPEKYILDFDNGRFMNHQDEPNTCDACIDNVWYLVATRDIAQGEELTCDYRDFVYDQPLTKADTAENITEEAA